MPEFCRHGPSAFATSLGIRDVARHDADAPFTSGASAGEHN